MRRSNQRGASLLETMGMGLVLVVVLGIAGFFCVKGNTIGQRDHAEEQAREWAVGEHGMYKAQDGYVLKEVNCLNRPNDNGFVSCTLSIDSLQEGKPSKLRVPVECRERWNVGDGCQVPKMRTAP